MGKVIIALIFTVLFVFNYQNYKKFGNKNEYVFEGITLIACIFCILVIIKMGLK
jgi:predicted signal transduction protein with EAL and GGDEF domain